MTIIFLACGQRRATIHVSHASCVECWAMKSRGEGTLARLFTLSKFELALGFCNLRLVYMQALPGSWFTPRNAFRLVNFVHLQDFFLP